MSKLLSNVINRIIKTDINPVFPPSNIGNSVSVVTKTNKIRVIDYTVLVCSTVLVLTKTRFLRAVLGLVRRLFQGICSSRVNVVRICDLMDIYPSDFF